MLALLPGCLGARASSGRRAGLEERSLSTATGSHHNAEEGEGREGQSRRGAPPFRSDAGDGNVVCRLMRRLPRAPGGPPGAVSLRAPAIMPSTWASHEAVRGLPFLHAAQSFLHRAQHRRHGRPRSTSPPGSARQTFDAGEAPSSWHGGRTFPIEGTARERVMSGFGDPRVF